MKKPLRSWWTILLGLMVSVVGGLLVSASQAAKRPNIIVILSDDMGYSDIGCYGSEIQTPNLNQLAANGLKFTRFYNTARCCPTRASLLTGLYPHQAGVGHMMQDRGHGGYRGDLNRRCVTIAEVLKRASYATYMVGKWHVTKQVNPKSDKDKFNWPLQRGFDHFYGTITGGGSFWDPSALTRDNTPVTIYSDEEYQPEEPFYYTDAIADNACKYVREHEQGKPFFMFVTYTAAHWPMHARPRDIAKYDGKYDGGYAPVRKARFERMKHFGVIKPNSELSAMAGDWSKVANKKWESACMEVYAAMVDSMDQGIGRLVDTLKKIGQLENTLIMYLQDNGGCAEEMGRQGAGASRKEKPSLPPIPFDQQHYWSAHPKQTRDGYPVRQGKVMPGPADTHIAYGRNWANVSNTPFREYKHWVHEGGISTPLIVHWPGRVNGVVGFRDQPAHLVDIMATCIDVAQADYPAEYAGAKIQPMEGMSLVPMFAGKEMEPRDLFWEHEGNRAVLAGKWKLVAKGRRGKWELYDIESDRSELHNLASKHPEKVNALSAKWSAYARRTQVLPWPDR